MTHNSDFKKLVRSRMERTGENYTTALAALQIDRDRAYADHLRRIRPFFEDGDPRARLLRIPAKRRTQLAVALEMLRRFDPALTYTETQVGAVLRTAHEDVAYLRRELVDYGLMERDGVGTYWFARTLPVRTGNLAQEVSDWERVWMPEFLAVGTRAALAD
ncbi:MULTISPECIES: DUF2087 domain-containing protein [Brevibacterium]|uniref:DUF2087 domain-containing protein n=1 Tax=Brevibacterium salitolerans TaxID=1403566 RepID=A0ABN2WJ42_9MICO|nr:DUF2087 domain-containing protein [Brevibacterium sp.]